MHVFKELDPILHNPIRLGIMSILLQCESASFSYLKDEIRVSAGNISLQLDKLEEVGYIQIFKGHKGNYPLTTAEITKAGKNAFQQYVKALQTYISPGNQKNK